LKPARIIISLIYAALFAVFFSGAVHEYNALLQFVPKSQFMPALLKSIGGITIASFAAVFVTVLAALFFGRVYCSAVCPLGIFQDFFIFLRYKINPKNKFKYSKGYFGFHLVMLAAAVLAYAAGVVSVMAVLEPYSAASRSAASFFSRSAVSAGVF
jgi:polyferredoxin